MPISSTLCQIDHTWLTDPISRRLDLLNWHQWNGKVRYRSGRKGHCHSSCWV